MLRLWWKVRSSSCSPKILLNPPSYGTGDSSYRAAGGSDGIDQLVHRFYEHMESLPEARAVRAMHADNVAESATSSRSSSWPGSAARTSTARDSEPSRSPASMRASRSTRPSGTPGSCAWRVRSTTNRGPRRSSSTELRHTYVVSVRAPCARPNSARLACGANLLVVRRPLGVHLVTKAELAFDGDEVADQLRRRERALAAFAPRLLAALAFIL